MTRKVLIPLIISFIGGLIFTLFYLRDFALFLLIWAFMFSYGWLIFKIRQFILNRYPRKSHKFKHIIIQFPLFSILSFGFVVAYVLLTSKGDMHFMVLPYESITYIAVTTAIFLITIFEGIDFFVQWKKYIIRSEQIEKENILAQYEALRNQLNPHFLFNGLNTLISFIETKDYRAAPFAQNLSDFLKYLLTYNKQELITIQEELLVVHQYIYLQSARFDNNLYITVDIPEIFFNWQIPPLTLQMLVENAIKHNKISSQHNLYIDIFEQQKYVFIKNNVQLKDNVFSAHVGIDNIKGRYRLFTESEVKIIETETEYLIGIPLLNSKVNT